MVWIGGPVFGQDRQAVDPFSPPPPRLVERLEMARDFLGRGRYPEAVDLLGSLIVERDYEDYFLPQESDTHSATVVKRAEEMVGNMPQRGRDLYELKFGTASRKRLEQAVQNADELALEETSRKYFHTSAGYVATLLIGRQRLVRGDASAAARCFQRILDSDIAKSRCDPQVSVLAAIALAKQERWGDGVALIESLKPRFPTLRVDIGDQVQVYSIVDSVATREWLEKLSTLVAPSPGLRPDQTKSKTDQQPEMGAPLSIPLWKVEFPKSKSTTTSTRQQPVSNDSVGHRLRTVLVSRGNQLLGIDLESGQRQWFYPWDQELNGSNADKPAPKSIRFTTGERSVFLVRQNQGNEKHNRTSNSHPTNELISLAIVDESGLSVEGRFRWRIDGAASKNNDLQNAFFLGPPFILDQLAYTIYEVPGQIRLAVISVKDGKLVWSQQLSPVHTRDPLQTRFRHTQNLTPVYQHGLLLCPTSHGSLVAVDLLQRSLHWGLVYPAQDAWKYFEMATGGEKFSSSPTGLVSHAGLLYFSPPDSDFLYVLQGSLGTSIWKLKREEGDALAGLYDGDLIIQGRSKITRLAGEIRKQSTLKLPAASVGSGYFDGDSYYIPTENQRLIRVDLKTLKVVSEIPLSIAVENVIRVGDRILLQSPNRVISLIGANVAKQKANQRRNENPDDPVARILMAQLAVRAGDHDEAIRQTSSVLETLSTTAIESFFVDCVAGKLSRGASISSLEFDKYEQLLTDVGQRRRLLQTRIEASFQDSNSAAAAGEIVRWLQLLGDSETAEQLVTKPNQIRQNHQVSDVRLMRRRLLQVYSALDRPDQVRMLDEFRASFQSELNRKNLPAIRTMADLFEDLQVVREFLPEVAELFFQKGSSADRLWCEAQLLMALTSVEGIETDRLQRNVSADKAMTDQQIWEVWRQLVRFYQADFQSGSMSGFADSQLRAAVAGWDQFAKRIGRVQDPQLRQIRESLPSTRRIGFPDGQVKVRSYDNLNDPDVYISGNERRFRSRLGFEFCLGKNGLSVEVSEDGAFVIRDRFGNRIFSHHSRARGGAFVGFDYEFTEYRQLGNLLLLSAGHDHVAIDLRKLNSLSKMDRNPLDGSQVASKLSKGDQAILWRFSTLSVEPDSFQNSLRRQIRKSSIGLDSESNHDVDGNRVGSVVGLSSNGMAILAGQKLICLDPWTGRVLWQRTEVGNQLSLAGDDRALFLLDPLDRTIAKVDWIDGKIEELKINFSPDDSPIHSGGTLFEIRNTNQPSTGRPGYELIAHDLFRLFSLEVKALENDPRPLWKNWFPLKTKFNIADWRTLAALTPDGVLTLHKTQSDLVKKYEPVPISFSPREIRMIRRDNEELLLLSRIPFEAAQQAVGDELRDGSLQVDGEIFSFSKTGTQQNWPGPVVIRRGELVPNQATSSPLLLFRQSLAKEELTKLVAIRTSDGSSIEFNSPLPGLGKTSIVKTQGNNQLVFNYGYDWLMLELTRFPRPVAPPGNLPMLTPLGEDRSVLGGFFKQLKSIFAQPGGYSDDPLEKWLERQWKYHPLNPLRRTPR